MSTRHTPFRRKILHQARLTTRPLSTITLHHGRSGSLPGPVRTACTASYGFTPRSHCALNLRQQPPFQLRTQSLTNFIPSYLCDFSRNVQTRQYSSSPASVTETYNGPIHPAHPLDGNTEIAGENDRIIYEAEKISTLSANGKRAYSRRSRQKRRPHRHPMQKRRSRHPSRALQCWTIHNSIRKDFAARRRSSPHLREAWEFALRSRTLYPTRRVHPPWDSNFSTLWQTTWNEGEEDSVWSSMNLDRWKAELALDWFHEVRRESTEVSLLRERWAKLDAAKAGGWWPIISLWCLIHSPRSALDFIEATKSYQSQFFNMTSDCLLYLDAFHYDSLTAIKQHKHRYESILYWCLQPTEWSLGPRHWRAIRQLLKRSTPEFVHFVMNKMVRQKISVPVGTVVYFLAFFTKQRDVNHAIRALRLLRYSPTPAIFSHPKILEHCCKLLTLEHVTETNGIRHFAVFPRILHRGVKPNLDLLNAAFHNALKHDMPEAVADVLRQIGEHGYTPDSYTYICLLEDALRRRDVHHFGVVLREIESDESLWKNHHITSKVLHFLYELSSETSNNNNANSKTSLVLGRMLAVYKRTHDIAPLVDLGLSSQQPSTLSATTQPSPHALVIMIAAFLRQHTRPSAVVKVFNRFVQLCREGHPSISPLAESDYIYNVFLMAFLQYPGLRIQNCAMVLDTMLQPLPPDTAVLEAEDNRPLIQARPTVQTWTIFLSAFVYEGQPEAAERVRAIMQKQGLKFNHVTWTTAIHGFASHQMLRETADAVKAMVDDGCLPNDHTMKAVGDVKRRDVLFALLDKLEGHMGGS
ncbi:hypothetical protein FQN50_006023 [Emmonsiellopsis sp. PD_5]|nr:hypothetical protein FQN50_006023 [Emmonsiellopsis sp. PD_5]